MRRRRKIQRISKKRSIQIPLIIFGLLIIIAATIYSLFFSEFLKIKNVDVSLDRVSCIKSEDLKNQLNLEDQNILFVKSTTVIKSIKEKNYCIKDINLQRNFPNTVLIRAFGRDPAAVLKVLENVSSDSARLKFEDQQASGSAVSSEATISAKELIVDNQGIKFSSDTSHQNLPVIFIRKYDQESVKKAISIIEKTKIFNIPFTQASIFEQTLYLDSKPRIIFSLKGDQQKQLASLQLILTKAKMDDMDTIDLRFEKPIVKYSSRKGEPSR